MNRIKLKKRYIIKKKNVFLITIVFFMILVYMIISIIDRKITPFVVEIAEIEINKFSTIIVNNAISRVLNDDVINQDIFSIVKSKDDRIQTIDFNSIIVNKVLNIVTTNVQNDLRLLENGNLEKVGIYNVDFAQNKKEKLKKGIITEIPIGVIFQNSLLSNFGPSIPIRFHYLGEVNSNIVTNIKAYGINNALVEVGINLEMVAQIVLPFTTKKIDLNYYIPVSIKVIQGIVPNYYGNGISENSQIFSLPF